MSVDSNLVPRHAERLPYGDAVRTAQRPSRFVPGCTAITEIFRCPKCSAEGEALTDHRTRACTGCGLHFQLRTMFVYVWAPLAVVA